MKNVGLGWRLLPSFGAISLVAVLSAFCAVTASIGTASVAVAQSEQTRIDVQGNRRVEADTIRSYFRVGGNERFAKSAGDSVNAFYEQGARVYAHDGAYARMTNPKDGSAPLASGLWPTDSFEGPLKTLFVTGEPIEIIHQPAAHTDGDLMVFFRKSDVVVAGDVFSTDRYPVIDVKHGGATNAKGTAATTELLTELEHGLIFVNLVETDQVYGHRHDIEGFARALEEIDAAVARWLELLGEDDLLILTADHGVDPTASHTDHTREYAPLLARFAGDGGRRHDGPLADVGASVLQWVAGREAPALPGTPFVR